MEGRNIQITVQSFHSFIDPFPKATSHQRVVYECGTIPTNFAFETFMATEMIQQPPSIMSVPKLFDGERKLSSHSLSHITNFHVSSGVVVLPCFYGF
jgi:hypothetical protein